MLPLLRRIFPVRDYTEINAQLEDADVTAVKNALALIESKLPFLVSLTNAERKKLRKAGPERLSFVQNSALAATNNPAIIPQSLDVPKFENAVTLFAQMTDISTVAVQLVSKIDDTRMDVGVHALSGASDVYRYVKTAAKKTPGLKPLADQLGQLYQKAKATRNANKKANLAATAAK